MIKKKTTYFQDQIENYLRNQLTEQEIDALWAEFLKSPALYDYFLSAVSLRAVFSDTKTFC